MQRSENNRTKYTGLKSALALLLWIGTVQASESDEIVLYDNLHVGPSRPSYVPPGHDDRLAQGFFTGPFGNVTSVSIETRRRGMPGGQLIVEIWDDNGTPFPGKKVGTLGSIELNSVATTRSVVTIEGLVDGLAPHTPYWVFTRVPDANWNSGTYYNWHVESDEGTYVGGSPPRLTAVVNVNNGRWRLLNDFFGSTAYSYTRMKVTSTNPSKSYGPQPADTVTDVRRDGVLSWQPGKFTAPVDGHIVYLSESRNDVSNGVDGITLSEARYEPSGLDFDTTYFWLVDQVSGPPGSQVYPGNIWSFTTEPFAYPIVDVVATGSGSLNPETTPAKTIDGSGLADERHGTQVNDMWVSDAVPTWIQYEFDRAYKLHTMEVWNGNQTSEPLIGLGAKEVLVEHSSNGLDWTALQGIREFSQGPGTEGYAANTVVDFGGTMAQYVRLTINSTYGNAQQINLSEVRFFYEPVRARYPQPADNATERSLDTALSWRPGREAESHRVYLSQDKEAILSEDSLVATTTEASLDLSQENLKYGETYYWKVNEVNELESPPIHVGDPWRFNAREFLAVDDMEHYRDHEGLEIWQHWVDGVGDETNGSIVGHENEAEKEQVVEGRQSLPLHYDHGPETVSSATLTFDAPLDWVRGDPQVLSLHFLGDPTKIRNKLSNDPAPVYLEVSDNSGQTVRMDYPDLAATHIIEWTEWVVPMSDLSSLDLSSIQSMTLGIGSTGVAAKGKMFFDNIRVGTPKSQE